MTRKPSLGTMLLLAAGACAASDPTAVCDAHVAQYRVAVGGHDRVDILLVLDTSASMVEERRHFLEVQWPRAIQLLLRGTTDDGKISMRPVGNLRVGVISSDLGAGAAGAVEGCSAHGAEARLQGGERCPTSKPSFVWHFEGVHDPAATELALRCVADVPADSCSLSQPLAAARQALSVPDANGGLTRNTALSVMVILTDRDDCSIGAPEAFASGTPLSAAEAASRCVRDPAASSAVQDYVDYLRAERPDNAWSVVPLIIAGVPPEWPELSESAETRTRAQRIQAYDALLADPRLAPGAVSCTSATASATAPVRLLQLAREFGPHAHLHSICDYDLAGALYRILDADVELRDVHACLRLPVVLDGQGFVPCRMTWELPPTADPEEPLTPVRCDERPELLTQPAPRFPQRSARGQVLCEVRQAGLAPGPDGSLVPQGEGFYADVHQKSRWCSAQHGLGIEFTERARPPNGVSVHFECIDEAQRERAAGDAAAIGDACALPGTRTGMDALCANPSGDHRPGRLLCHPQTNRCVRACDADSECPTDWRCEVAAGVEVRVCIKPGCE